MKRTCLFTLFLLIPYTQAFAADDNSTVKMCGKHALTSTNACIGDTSDCIPDDVTGNRGRIQLLVASDFFLEWYTIWWYTIMSNGIQNRTNSWA